MALYDVMLLAYWWAGVQWSVPAGICVWAAPPVALSVATPVAIATVARSVATQGPAI